MMFGAARIALLVLEHCLKKDGTPAMPMTALLSDSRRTQHPCAAALIFLAGVLMLPAATPSELALLEAQVIALRDRSKWVEAAPLAAKLVAETAALIGENHADTADALHHWAWLVQHNGDQAKAEKLWKRALAIDENLFGRDTLPTTRRMHLLANLYRDCGNYRESVPLLERAAAIRQKCLGPDHIETAQIVFSLGRLYLEIGDFAVAEAHLIRALKIYEEAHSYNAAAALSALGRLYASVGDDEKAEEMIMRAFNLRKRTHGMEHQASAHSLREVAMILRRRGQLEKAAQILAESIAIGERLLGTNHVTLAGVLNDLAETFLAQRNYDGAERVLDRALAIVGGNPRTGHPDEAGILMTLSRVHEARGDYRKAMIHGRRAYELRSNALGGSHPTTLSSLHHLADLHMALGEPERALEMADRLQAGEESLLENVLSFTSERQRLAAQKNSAMFRYRPDLWADLGAVGPLGRAVLRTKAIVLDSLMEDRRLADASGDPDIRELMRKGMQARQLLACASNGFSDRSDRGEITRLSREIDRVEAALARRLDRGGTLRQAMLVNEGQVSSVLGKRMVLLEMVRYHHYAGRGRREEHYGALLFSQRQPPRWIRLGPATAIHKSIKLFEHAVRSPDASEALVRASRELHDLLWMPIRLAFPAETERVIVSPDGELNFVSFAALLSAEHRFVGEEFLVSYISCARDLLARPLPPPEPGTLAVWANPDFDATFTTGETNWTTSGRGTAVAPFPPLPGTAKEGKALAGSARDFGFRDALLFEGAAATEASLRHIRAPAGLHLATHGFVWRCRAVEAVRGDAIGPEAGEFVLPAANPMLRCGFALAGARRTLIEWGQGTTSAGANDGIVTAQDVSGLDLRGTWIVALSGCDTGMGESRTGEGVLGLRRGFVQAGARNLLLALWPVDDEQTLTMMPAFYLEMHRTSLPAEALARVQREWLGRLRREKGVAEACRIAGPFILSFQGAPGQSAHAP
jgi:CHAT domain-containing protein/tetratricopeptide (TPR) repeat protein